MKLRWIICASVVVGALLVFYVVVFLTRLGVGKPLPTDLNVTVLIMGGIGFIALLGSAWAVWFDKQAKERVRGLNERLERLEGRDPPDIDRTHPIPVAPPILRSSTVYAKLPVPPSIHQPPRTRRTRGRRRSQDDPPAPPTPIAGHLKVSKEYLEDMLARSLPDEPSGDIAKGGS